MSAIMEWNESKSQLQMERILIEKRMENFDYHECAAMIYLSSKFTRLPSRIELVSLAKVCSKHTGIYLDREAYRRKTVLIKWFDENLKALMNFIDNHIQVE